MQRGYLSTTFINWKSHCEWVIYVHVDTLWREFNGVGGIKQATMNEDSWGFVTPCDTYNQLAKQIHCIAFLSIDYITRSFHLLTSVKLTETILHTGTSWTAQVILSALGSFSIACCLSTGSFACTIEVMSIVKTPSLCKEALCATVLFAWPIIDTCTSNFA
jgi:hypothetical protein